MAGFGDFFRNKIVLLGDANPDTSADKFIVPGEHEPIPGIYIHASAIYTLSQAPLYQLSCVGGTRLFPSRFCIEEGKSLTLLVAWI